MRPSVPDGDLGAIVEQAVTEKLQRLEARRFARTQAPRKTLSQSETSPTTRLIPAAVKRAVYERDGGRCRYEDTVFNPQIPRKSRESQGATLGFSRLSVPFSLQQCPQRIAEVLVHVPLDDRGGVTRHGQRTTGVS
jgi:hypothetical protein